MDGVFRWFQSEGVTQLLLVLLHSLWQAVVIAGSLHLALRLIAARSASTRYAVALGALALVAVAGFITWGVLGVDPSQGRPQPASSRVETFPELADAGRGQPLAPSTAPGAPSLQRTRSGGVTDGAPGVPWQVWLGSLWASGLAVMLFRAARLVHGAERLRRESSPLLDPTLVEIVEDLRARMGLCRATRILTTPTLAVPAVVGVLWPALLVPAGMVSNLSTEQIRMIVAHELAHIRRHDYLVNLLQLLTEAILFFNPAVWWISRQIRIEREACCDAEAVRVAGAAGDYARTLVHYASSLGSAPVSTSAVGLSVEQEGSLLSRIRRLVHPGHRPALRVSWPKLLVVLLGSVAALVALEFFAGEAVRIVAEIMSPRERIEKISRIARTHRPEEGSSTDYHDLEKVQVDGLVFGPGGALEVEGRAYVSGTTRRPHATIGHSLRIEGGRFSGKMTPGEISLVVSLPGFAPAFAGPLRRGPGEKLTGLLFELTPGFTARIEVVGGDGEPVSNAVLDGRFRKGRAIAGSARLESGTEGVILVEHATSDAVFEYSLRADGHQYVSGSLELDPAGAHRISLRRARPTTGRVVSASTGEPVSGARMLIVRRSGFDEFTRDPREEWVRKRARFWTADENGQFNIDSLRDDCTYAFCVEAPDHAASVVSGLRAGQADVEVELGPPLEIRGRIPEGRDRVETYRGRPVVVWGNPLRLDDTTFSHSFRAPVEFENGDGTFTIRELFPGEVWIRVGDLTVERQVRESIEDLIIDPRRIEPETPARETRRVIVRVVPPDDSPTPDGMLRVDYVPPGKNAYRPFWLELEEGQASIDVPLPVGGPGKFRYGPLRALGYWIEERSGIPVPRSPEPMVLEARARPAGAIHGSIVGPGGEPCREFNLTVIVEERPEIPGGDWPDDYGEIDDESPAGKYLLAAVPLGGRYRVSVEDGRVDWFGRAISGAIVVSAEKPIHEVKLEIPRGEDVRIRVVDETGAPVPGAQVSLQLSTPWGHSFGSVQRTAGLDGELVFRGVNRDLPAGSYFIRIKPHRGLCGREVPLASDPAVQTVRLRSGLGLRGRILDDRTGKPLGGTRIALWKVDPAAEYPETFRTTTASDGSFEFSGLEPVKYGFNVPGAWPAGTTATIDEKGRVWYSRPDDAGDRVDLSTGELPQRLEIRVMTRDDPRLDPRSR